MKTFYSNKEIPHLWAHKQQQSARGSNFFFEGDTIYSYGYHFPIARHVIRPGGTQQAILFTTSDYSSTTSRHIGMVKQSIPDSIPILYVPNPGKSFLDIRGDFAVEIAWDANNILQGKTKPARTKRYNELLKRISRANSFSEFVGLKPHEMPESLQSLVTELEEMRAKNIKFTERAKADADKRDAERLAERRQQQAAVIQDWINGDESAEIHHDIPEVYLRIRNFPPAFLHSEIAYVETSKGALFPLTDALRALPLVRRLRGKGGEFWLASDDRIKLGNYYVKRLLHDGTVVAGCHRVLWSEVERFGAILDSLGAEK